MGDGADHDPQDKLPELLASIWGQVSKQVNRLIEAHDQFGFVKFQEALNPSLTEVLKAFEFVDFALTQLVDSGLLGYDEKRNALNSKQCILQMKLLAVALDDDRQDEYDRIMGELQAQAKF